MKKIITFEIDGAGTQPLMQEGFASQKSITVLDDFAAAIGSVSLQEDLCN